MQYASSIRDPHPATSLSDHLPGNPLPEIQAFPQILFFKVPTFYLVKSTISYNVLRFLDAQERKVHNDFILEGRNCPSDRSSLRQVTQWVPGEVAMSSFLLHPRSGSTLSSLRVSRKTVQVHR